MRFGPYEVTEKFGAGGMGDIWIGVHAALGRTAAIKVIRPDALGGAGSDIVLKRFEREARATSKLRSPHTIEVYDFGITDDGVFYYAMEFLEGCNLETLIERRGPIHAGRAAWILRQVCDSLEEAHRAGLVHRDIKPANIHLCKMGLNYDFVKVLDFGLVKANALDGDANMTDTSVVHGTPAFMPPEIIRGAASLGPAADIYSLGCVAYWLVTGHLVFDAPNPMAVVLEHIESPPVPPSQRTELPIPEAFERLVMHCLEKDPADRPRSAAELARMLRAREYEQSWSADHAEEWWLAHCPQMWAAPNVLGTPSMSLGTAAPVRREQRISVAVLPFENTSGDEDQVYFSEGVAEDVIRELGRFNTLSVTSRGSSFAFKDGGMNTAEIAQQLAVQYIVEGSVRRAGKRLRLSVSLSDARRGKQLWAERYDRSLDDLFDVQDDIVQRIVATVAGRLHADDTARAKSKPTSSLDAWDCMLRGMEQHNRHTPDAARLAVEWFERAAELDPELAPAYAWQVCAWSGTGEFPVDEDGFPVVDDPRLQRAEALLNRAFEIDPSEPEVNRILADVQTAYGNLDRAQFHLDQALAVNPNNERLICGQGELYICVGEPEKAIEWIRRAMEVNPFHPARWWGHLGRALHEAGRCEEALAAFKRLPTPRLPDRVYKIACAHNLGRTAEAAAEIEAIRREAPNFSANRYIPRLQLRDPERRQRLIATVVAAGLPE